MFQLFTIQFLNPCLKFSFLDYFQDDYNEDAVDVDGLEGSVQLEEIPLPVEDWEDFIIQFWKSINMWTLGSSEEKSLAKPSTYSPNYAAFPH